MGWSTVSLLLQQVGQGDLGFPVGLQPIPDSVFSPQGEPGRPGDPAVVSERRMGL